MVTRVLKPEVRLTGRDGNAFAILGEMVRALKKSGYSRAERAAFVEEVKAGDYDNLLRVCMRWADVV